MKRIFADINQKWELLSDDHEKLVSHFNNILESFLQGEEIHPSYLITGVFGAGKTMFMIEIFKTCVNKGLFPIYVLAEDIFTKITGTTLSSVKSEINKFVKSAVEAFNNRNFEQIKGLINTEEGELKNDLIDLLSQNCDKMSHPSKVVLLVDELEDKYKLIKDKVGPDPLRVWLEDRSYLKILSLTPSGIYDLGGADDSRLVKWGIPPVSIEYLRGKIELSTGKANALWWLSRGIPRHIIQNLGKLREISEGNGSYKISETLKSFERIGKKPGRVNAVETSSLSDHSKIKFLINLIPQRSQLYKGFIVTNDLEEGKLSNIFQKMFDLIHGNRKDLALSIAHYFKLVAMTLSDQTFNTYVDANEINEFMELTLDILLENEYKKLVVQENMAKLLGIYEKLRTESTLLLTSLITTSLYGISFRDDVDKRLPFAINEIRRLFPLPMANPVIRSSPDEVMRDVEGKGMPVCKSDIFMLFASYRDFDKYLATNEFKNSILPDRGHSVILLPEDEFEPYEKAISNPTSKNEQFLEWLLDNDKLRVVKSPSSIKVFLLSLYGYENRIPYNISNIAQTIKPSQDILLKKKFELYHTALNELLEDNKPTPTSFFGEKSELKGLSDIWGTSQLKEEDVAVVGLALAFYNISPKDIANLLLIRELFRTKERRGDLADIKVGRGLPTLADDLLPRKDRKGRIVDAPSVKSLRDFWSKDEEGKLDKLARLLELSEFKKLGYDANHKRTLEAFWRAMREKFDLRNTKELNRRLEEVIKKLEFIQEIEKKYKEDLELTLNFEKTQENIVETLDGLKKLVRMSFEGNLPKFIIRLLLEAILNKTENVVNILHNEVQRIDSKVESLKGKVSNIIKYLSSEKEISDFISDEASFTDVKQELESLTVINNDLNLTEAEHEIEDRLRDAETTFQKFTELESKLKELKQKLSDHNLLEVRQ